MAFTQAGNLNSLPKGVHQWAQADRYAIAARYSEGLPLLSPATYSIISDRGEVGVEFPLIQYVSGRLAASSWTRPYLPLFYRSLTLLLLVFGLFRLISAQPNAPPFWIRLVLSVFLISSPLLLFYGYNFSPDVAALAFVLVGLSYLDARLERFFPVLLCFGIAALLKTSAGIYLLAFLGSYAFLRFPKEADQPEQWIWKLLAALLVLASIAVYDVVYIHERNKELWSTLFLSRTNPIPDLDTANSVLGVMTRWRMEYFTTAQWIALAGSLAFALGMGIRNRFRSGLWFFVLLTGLGLIAILYLFGTQFMHHDYYFIAPFTPILLWGMIKVGTPLLRHSWAVYTLIGLCIWSFTEGSNQHFDRSSANCEIKGEYHQFDFEWLQQLRTEVDSLIDPEEKVFVVYELEPNLALSYMDRLGIVFNPEEMGRQESNFYYWLERRQPEYILCRRANLELFRSQHGLFLKRCSVVMDRPDYVLFAVHGY